MKTTKRTLAVLLAALIFVGCSYAAPPAKKHAPDFKLRISTDAKVVNAQKDMEISVDVEEKNISSHIVNAGRPLDPGEWYTMSVLLDGHSAPITERYRAILSPKRIDENPNVAVTMDGFSFTIKPGESGICPVTLSAFFDLSAPGKYKITFSRGTDPGQPDNVEVKSNTIIITVLPAEAQ